MNRQVPKKIAIIGDGKVARHMVHYFELIGQPHTQWSRKQAAANTSSLAQYQRIQNKIIQSENESLAQCIDDIEHVLILIPDDQIEAFIASNLILKNKTCIHFSGSLNTELAVGCHPLMTFGSSLYDLETYKNIPFIIDEGLDFKEIFPLFDNPVYDLNVEYKAIYHAFCVMAGNFSQMLWKKISEEMPNIDLPQDVMSIYLAQNTANFIANPKTSATGPLVRGDFQTIQKHIQALSNHPLLGVYKSFMALNQPVQAVSKRKSS